MLTSLISLVKVRNVPAIKIPCIITSSVAPGARVIVFERLTGASSDLTSAVQRSVTGLSEVLLNCQVNRQLAYLVWLIISTRLQSTPDLTKRTSASGFLAVGICHAVTSFGQFHLRSICTPQLPSVRFSPLKELNGMDISLYQNSLSELCLTTAPAGKLVFLSALTVIFTALPPGGSNVISQQRNSDV